MLNRPRTSDVVSVGCGVASGRKVSKGRKQADNSSIFWQPVGLQKPRKKTEITSNQELTLKYWTIPQESEALLSYVICTNFDS